MAEHLGKLESCYGAHEARRVMCLDPWDIPNAKRLGLDDLARWAAGAVREGEVS